MAQAGPNSVGTDADDATVGTLAWTTLGNAAVSDDVRDAHAGGSGTGDLSHYLKCTNFGFAVPSTATIDGIEVKVEASATTSVRWSDSTIKLFKVGTGYTGNNKAQAGQYTNTDEVRTYGGAADLWGAAWTPADVNNSGFGVGLSYVRGSGAGTNNTRVDLVTISVYYTDAASSKVVTIVNTLAAA